MPDAVAARIWLALLLLSVLMSSTLAFGFYGIQRSLWLDEAWVANSVHAPSLREMFYYPGWLQTSPPLFLLLERGAVRTLGLSNAGLRAVPLALEMAAVGLFFVAARRAVVLPLAALATVIVAFHPLAIEYSRTAKQYSGEVAATAALLAAAAAYFSNASTPRFRWLLLTLVVTMPLSYPAVFLIPGLIVAVGAMGEHRQAVWLALAASAIFATLYPIFIQPNYAPVLREFWLVSPERFWTVASIGAILVSAVGLGKWGGRPRLHRTSRSGSPSVPTTEADVDVGRGPGGPPHSGLYLICALPGLLLAAASASGWYPATPRTWLFLLPCLVMLIAMLADELLRRWPRLAVIVWIGAALIPVAAGWRQVHQHRNLPEEDFAGAVQFLRQHAAPSDLLLVHPSVKEGFELYAAMDGFAQPQPMYGATGWPCCVRDHLAPPHSSSRQAVIDDLESKIPKTFSGRVWLVYSSRPTQWDYVGLDEGNLWRSQVWAMGCPPEQFVAFTNVAISPMVCSFRNDPRR
jgi:hypothetical protein